MLKQQLQSLNHEIEEKNLKNAENSLHQEENLKNKCDQLYKSKIALSQIQVKNQTSQLRHEKIERNNKELFEKTQEIINKKLAYEEHLSSLDREGAFLKNKLLMLTEKLSVYQLIKESYEDAYENYKNNRIEVYKEQKRLNNYLQELKGNIRVFCKIRPILAEDKSDPAKLEISDRSITIFKGDKPSKFIFDRVFGPNTHIDEVFEEISQLVQSALDGYKVCIFAYGQTGSGKTYTMEGTSNNIDYIDNKNKGIIQKSVELMFTASQKLKEIG